MLIVHFGPYAPNRAGNYEAARDMIRADVERGHTAIFVDVGPTHVSGEQDTPQTGTVDDRGGFQLVTMDPAYANDADLLIFHTGVNDNWVVGNQAPIISIVHSRPLAAFRQEQNNPRYISYSLIAQFARWPRVKKLVHFWPEYDAHWRVIVPEDKLVSLPWPPIDLERFGSEGSVYQFPPDMTGEVNAVICDSWREDIDCYEVTLGAIEAAKLIPGLKVHLFAIDTRDGNALPGCWDLLTQGLRQYGALGTLNARVPDIEQVFRAVDFVMTPNRIVTRIVGEALACGIPVLAAKGCKATPWTADMTEPEEVGQVARNLVDALRADKEKVQRQCRKQAQAFSLAEFGKGIEPVYQEVVNGPTWWTR